MTAGIRIPRMLVVLSISIDDFCSQGWGMVDGMHAVVFVDNHDNQVTILFISTFRNSRHPLDHLDHLDQLDHLVHLVQLAHLVYLAYLVHA